MTMCARLTGIVRITFGLFLSVLLVPLVLNAQQSAITFDQVDAHIRFLSSDDLKGRAAFSEEIKKAEEYIAERFKKAGLKSFQQFPNFMHEFTASPGRRNQQQGQEFAIRNVVGYIEGTDPVLKEEFIVFSAHHDHVGVRGTTGDTIFNGADDDASGTTAVITLAEHFAKVGGNKRTLMFVTFTAEERGGLGSRKMLEDLPTTPEKVIAMVNIEMIGKDSKFGENTAWITGYERSDFGKILQEGLKDDPFSLYPDPYPDQNLFFRSDNARFARAGIPAHTISTVQIDIDEHYHAASDEYETLNIQSMTVVIRGIARAVQPLISGAKTPSRIKDARR